MEKLSKDYLGVIVESIPDPLLVIGSDYRILFMNRAAKELYPDDKTMPMDITCHEMSRGRDRPCVEYSEHCPVLEVFRTGKLAKDMHQLRDRQGHEIFYEIIAAPVVDAQGKAVEVVTIFRDVTDSVLYEKLKNSETQYQLLVNSTTKAIITFNAKGTIVDCNPATETIFGHAANSLIGEKFYILVPQAARAGYASDFENAIKTKQYKYVGRTIEINGLRKSGEEFPLNLTLSTWKSSGKKLFTAIAEDITERKQLENMLQAEKEILKTAQQEIAAKHGELERLFKYVESAKREWEQSMDCVHDIVLLVDREGAIVRANKTLTDMIRKPFPEILGRLWEELLQECGLVKNGRFGEYLEFVNHLTGNIYSVQINPVDSVFKGKTSQVIIFHDLTEIKKLTRELEEKNNELDLHRKNLQRALDELEILIRRVIEEKEFGVYFTLPSNLEQCWRKMQCDRKDCPCHGREPLMCWQIAGTQCDEKVQGEMAEKIGDCRQCKLYQEATSDPTYQIGIQFNNMMNVLEAKNKELEKAYAELKATQIQVLQQEKMASIGQLAAGVAHEINNPIGFVTSNIGTLMKYVDRLVEYCRALEAFVADLKDAEGVDQLKKMHEKLKIDFVVEDIKDLIRESLEGTERVKSIVMNLKDFSRVDQAAHAHADINECLESTLNIVWNELKYKTTVHKEYSELPQTKCYPQQLNQVFTNLLVNAAQAIEEHGDIIIKTWADAGHIYVAVSDTGCGIKPENLNKVFEPFFTTKEVGKGTGLGLSIAYDIITKQHNGEFAVSSEVGKGTTFRIKLPILGDE